MPRSRLFSLKNGLWFIFFLALTIGTRCANFRNVFVTSADGDIRQVYFIDGDCYSRMTRVREIMEGWGIIHYHAWENFPRGTWPHTTLPMDYLIAGLALILKPFTPQYVDIAGAIISPIFGVLITIFLAIWARELNQQYRRLMLLLASLSPILVHGTALGRPDHQSLQMLLLAIGIGAELIMARAPRVSWGIVSGIAWGLALWVSLYEPLVILAVIYITKLIFYRPNLLVKERLWGLGCFAAILSIAWLLEGQYLMKSFAIEARDQALKDYFGRWTSTIGEMRNGEGVFKDLLFIDIGFGMLVAPLLLIARLRDTKRSVLLLALMVTTFILTMTQERWAYFFALVYAMSLPWQLSLFKWKWAVWTMFLLSLYPMARSWEARIHPSMESDMLRDGRLNDQRRLRQAAEFIAEKAPGGILAPWWWSPQLVYWSGQPAVAGSSHESLAGIVDTARFFTATDGLTAKSILDDRQVETVVTGNPGNILSESLNLLGQPMLNNSTLPGQQPGAESMVDIMWEKPHSVPMFMHLVFDNNVVKVFEVNHGFIKWMSAPPAGTAKPAKPAKSTSPAQ